jgi:hypothetical protein
MEKYGFVYIWFDRKHKRFYIGCHWGKENDGYVCSSPWMKQAYKHRPQDFKRKILKTDEIYATNNNTCTAFNSLISGSSEKTSGYTCGKSGPSKQSHFRHSR